MTPQDSETFTYRGRSLEELVPRIRQELGDDAVIVARRETTSGGVGGFFARREIEVEVRAGESAVVGGRDISAAFAAQLAEAHERQHQPGVARPMTSPEIDALPGSTNVTVDDLFPAAPPPQAQGLAALFNAGLAPAAPAPEAVVEPEVAPAPEPEAPPEPPAPPRAERREVIEDDEEWDDDEWEEAVADPELVAPDPEPAAEPVDDLWAPRLSVSPEFPPVDQPTGAFDYLGVGEAEVEPEAVVEPEPLVEPGPAPIAFAPPVAGAVPVAAAPADELLPATAPAPVAGLPPAALVAAERLVARGLRAGLAEAIAEEAMAGLAPLLPEADPKALVVDALARRIPMHPLRRGPGVVGFVGPGGAGKTRCVARLAAAHARHGVRPVTVVALRSPDGGAELRRLLAPYGVALHAVESGAEGAARIAGLRGEGLVIVDTPGVSPRSTGELRALGFELDSLAPDELHLAVPATIGPAAAQELVGGVRELGVGALALTHTDETEVLGTVIGLAIDSGLPLSYLARGQAVEAGLRPASATELANDLVP
jgi:flagellar biosynthesis protein FlhF